MFSSIFTAHAATPDFTASAQELLTKHYQQYKDLEYFSGAALSIYIPGQKIQNYYIGNVSHDNGSIKINADTLFKLALLLNLLPLIYYCNWKKTINYI